MSSEVPNTNKTDPLSEQLKKLDNQIAEAQGSYDGERVAELEEEKRILQNLNTLPISQKEALPEGERDSRYSVSIEKVEVNDPRERLYNLDVIHVGFVSQRSESQTRPYEAGGDFRSELHGAQGGYLNVFQIGSSGAVYLLNSAQPKVSNGWVLEVPGRETNPEVDDQDAWMSQEPGDNGKNTMIAVVTKYPIRVDLPSFTKLTDEEALSIIKKIEESEPVEMVKGKV